MADKSYHRIASDGSQVQVKLYDLGGGLWSEYPAGGGETHLGEVSIPYLNASGSFTRPATAPTYTTGDLIANHATAGSVVPIEFTCARVAGGRFELRRLRALLASTVITNASFRLHLYATAPTVANGDDGVFSSTNAANYLGAFDVTVDRTFSDGAVGIGLPVIGSEIIVDLASGLKIYGLLEARAAYVGVTGDTLSFVLEGVQG